MQHYGSAPCTHSRWGGVGRKVRFYVLLGSLTPVIPLSNGEGRRIIAAYGECLSAYPLFCRRFYRWSGVAALLAASVWAMRKAGT